MSNYYENQILQAIDTVASSLISKVSFDKTILCSIENADNSANGIYTVNDGSSSFEAYSTNTDYKEGMSVYVLIPEGDYKNQKTIVSRYVATGENAVDYVSPMSKFIKIEDFSFDSKETGLLANGDKIKTESLLDCKKLGNNAYNYIGISAKFRTELPKYTFTSGRYGLLLELILELEDKTKTTTTILGFYNDEMYGNSYSYTFDSTQEIVFDLKNINQPIKGFRVYFVQDKNFRYMNEETGEDVQLPSAAKVKMNNNEVQVPLSNNLFVSDIQVSFGYKLEGIKEESVRLYTPNKLTYSTTEAKEKTILLKYFVPKPDGTYTIIDDIEKIDIEKNIIHWYRYKMDNGIEDSIAGIFWEEIQRAEKNLFNYNFTPNKELSREKIKVIYEIKTEIEEEVEVVQEDGTTTKEKTTTTTSKYLESNELVFENADAAAQNLHDVDLIRELKLECTDDSNGIYKLYNEIDNKIFNSENTKDRTLNAVFDVYTSADITANEVGKNKVTWRIPKNNSMISPVDFTINLHEFEVKEGEKKGTAQKITWNEDTDCYYCEYDWGCDYIGEQDKVLSYEGTDNHYTFSLPMHYCIGEYYSSSYNNNTIECIINRYGKEYKAEIEFIFGNSGTNGTYYTINIRLGKSYGYSDKEIGEPTSLTPVPALTANSNEMVEVIPSLYDEKGEEITDVTFSQSWKKSNEKGIECIKIDGRYFLHYLDSIATKNEETNQEIKIGDHYGILSFSTAQYYNENRARLESYFPVGIRRDDTITAYRGTTKVVYDVQGSNPIYQTEHELTFKKDISPKPSVVWQVKVLQENTDQVEQLWENYAPYFKEQDYQKTPEGTIEKDEKNNPIIVKFTGLQSLMAKDMFFSELEEKRRIVIQAYDEKSKTIYYQQSLLYTQNRFGNQMLNDWDGKLKINEKDNYILSALVGAGKKEINNSFSGVLMGEVTSGGYTDKETGLFGYGQGVQNFGFRTDGTAFLGKSGSGQITFNEKGEGIIASATGNTTINLKDGNIKLSNEKVNNDHSAEITIDSSGEKGYFVINEGSSTKNKDEQTWTYSSGTNLIYIGNNKYYLQSKNFTDQQIISNEDGSETIIPAAGVKFDLNQGKLKGYNFELLAGQKQESGNYELTITSDVSKNPLEIGSNFSVSWDGKVTASEGDFAGRISANSGKIGNWIINEKGIYYGYDFNTNGGIPSTNVCAFFVPIGLDTGTYDSNTSEWSKKDIVLNIGTNFYVDKDGKLYASSVDLTGSNYYNKGEVDSIRSSLENSINNVESNVSIITNKVNGSISNIGTIGNTTVFLSQTYTGKNLTIEEGYYDETDKKFYVKSIGYKEDDLMICQNEQCYYDYTTKKVYKYNGTNFTEVVNNTDPIYGKGYYNSVTGKFYYKQSYSKGSFTLVGETSKIYYDLDTGLVYKYSLTKGYIKCTEEDNVTIFRVDSEGLLTAANAVISGTIYATNGWFSGGITASEGTIGGWNITEKALYYGGKNDADILFSLDDKKGAIIAPEGIKVKLSDSITKTDIVLNVGENFSVNTDGNLDCSSGTIAGWDITPLGFSKTIDDDTYFVSAAYGSSITSVNLTFGYYKNEYLPSEEGVNNRYTATVTIADDTTWESVVNSIWVDGCQNGILKIEDTVAFNPVEEFSYKLMLVVYQNMLNQNKILGIKKTNGCQPFSIDGKGNLVWEKDSSNNFMLGFSASDNVLGLWENGKTLLEFNESKVILSNFRTNSDDNYSRPLGLSLNSEGCWDDFWNNALFTKKIFFNASSETSEEYVAFLRGFGSSSSSFENVFLGCKSIAYKPSRDEWTTNSVWASTSASYNFYIKFNGKAKFNSLTVDNNISFPGKASLEEGPDNWIGNKPNINISYISPWNSDSTNAKCAYRPNNAGLYYPAIKITNDKPLNYNVILQSNCGQQTDSSTNVYWVVGTDNSHSSSTYYYNFILSLSADNSTYYNYYPRQNLYYQVERSSSNPKTDDVYLFTNCSNRNATTGVEDECTTANSNLGSDTYPWTYGYITNCVQSTASAASLYTETEGNTSDARLKDIQSDYNLQKALDIYNNLSPIAYKYKNLQESDSHSRTHIGFIAQEVEKQIAAAGLTSEEFAAVQIKNLDTPEPGCEDGKKYYLNYNEFHGLHVLKNQEQDKRIQELENRVQELEEKLREKGV